MEKEECGIKSLQVLNELVSQQSTDIDKNKKGRNNKNRRKRQKEEEKNLINK